MRSSNPPKEVLTLLTLSFSIVTVRSFLVKLTCLLGR